MKFKVIVPATTANLGPGFDISGCALSLYNEFDFDFTQHSIRFTDDDYEFEESLTLESFFKVLKLYQIDKPKGVHLHTISRIPVARGLGSSSTCIVAGVLAANKYANLNLSSQKMCQLASDIEGHPDNVVSAILGSFNMTLYQDHFFNIQVDVHPDIEFIALVPKYAVKTQVARDILPQSYSLSDIQINLSAIPFVKMAFESKDKNLLRMVTQDRIHEPYRKHLIKEYNKVYDLIEDLDPLAFCISGAGPTMLLALESSNVPYYMQYLKKHLADELTLLHCQIDKKGAMIK